MTILRTTSENPDFQKLVKQLDIYLALMDGDAHAFYHQYNKIDLLKNCVVIFDNDEAVACGAIKELDTKSMEVKRMFTLPEKRGKGLASAILRELETWSKELGYEKTVLETGKKQVEAVALYNKYGYKIIPNYGQYIGVDNSVCFEKILD
ncbi:MAG TPA: GNAT family N-acetyltransferase [Chryseobacterium sp.]|nr:GNAT family N-acetyltransferase [Chryseobacterium sp.]